MRLIPEAFLAVFLRQDIAKQKCANVATNGHVDSKSVCSCDAPITGYYRGKWLLLARSGCVQWAWTAPFKRALS